MIKSIPTGDDLDQESRAEIREVLFEWPGTVPVNKNGDAEISLNVAAGFGGSGGVICTVPTVRTRICLK